MKYMRKFVSDIVIYMLRVIITLWIVHQGVVNLWLKTCQVTSNAP